MERLTVIDTPQQAEELKQLIKDKTYLAYDTETTGLKKTDEIIGFAIATDAQTAFYLVLAAWDKETKKLNYLPGMKELGLEVVKSLIGKRLIMHNAVFDCMITQGFFGVDLMPSLHTDTMVMAHILDENRRVGLKELGSNLFGDDSRVEQTEMKASIIENGGAITKDNYELYKGDAYLIARYGAKDTILTYKLFLEFDPQLKTQKLDKFFYEDECMPLLRGPTYELNTVGLQVDVRNLTILKKTLEAECLEDNAFIHQEIARHVKEKYPGTNKKNHFNIGSSQQLAWLLFGAMKLDFSLLTKEGKKLCRSFGLRLPYTGPARRDFINECLRSKGREWEPGAIVNGKTVRPKKVKDPWAYIAVDKRTLSKLAPKHTWIQRLIDYNKKQKILNTYVEGIEERTQYGIIQPSFLQTGTTSGRYSSRNPNFQNLPRDDKRVKSCIVARPGKLFVGADYSQLEPRVFAFTSGDKRLMEAFQGTDDFYSVIGIEVYDKYDATPHKEGSPQAFGIKYKSLRDSSKVIALASTYGATAHQLAPTTGKSIEDTQEDIDKYFEKFPGVKEMMLQSHEMAKNNGVVYNHFGRPRRMPEAKRIRKIYGNQKHADLPYEARNMLNLAVNHRIQSTGASIVNRAAIQFHAFCKEAGIDCQMVLQVHDSLVVECNEADAEDVAVLLEEAMINTSQLEGIKLEAIPRIGKNLSEV